MADARVQLIIPTAINMITAVNEVFVTRHKAGQPIEVDIPTLRRRALMVVKESGVLALQMTFPPDNTRDFNR